jgi:hypothetical protein
MMLRGALAALLALSGCASAGTAPADPNLNCRLHQPVSYVDSLRRLPPVIQDALKRTVGAMADRGEFFNAGDVVTKPGPFNRFIRGGTVRGFWFVWYEHGGFAYWHQVVIFAPDPTDKTRIVLLTNQPAKQGDLCAETDRLLE